MFNFVDCLMDSERDVNQQPLVPAFRFGPLFVGLNRYQHI